MKKLFMVVLLMTGLFGTELLAQSFEMKFVTSEYPVNRVDNIVWIDVQMSNDQILKDLKFDVNLSFLEDGNPTTRVIPAYCLNPDGSNDPSKWTSATQLGQNSWAFHYWMDPNRAEHFLPINLVFRKVMRFYVKFDTPIPDCGKMVVYCSNFRAMGVTNTGAERSFIINPSYNVSHTVILGDCPDEQVIVNLAANAVVNRGAQINQLKLRLDYLSPKAFKQISFDLLVPQGWGQPIANFISDQATINMVPIATDKWRVSIDALSSIGFPPSLTYKPWLEMVWNFPSQATGVVEFVMNKVETRDLSGQNLYTIKELRKSVDLGQSIDPSGVKFFITKPANWFTLSDYNITRYGNVFMEFNIDNTKRNLKMVSFDISMPAYFNIQNTQILIDGAGRYADVWQTSTGNGLRNYTITALAPLNSSWPANAVGDNPKVMMFIKFNFVDLPYGTVNFQIRNIIARDVDGIQVNETPDFDYPINFIPEFVRFKKGDSDYNFGNGALNWIDLNLLRDYLDGVFKDPSLYQLWAFDVNGDGVIDQKDYDLLLDIINGTSSVKDEYDSEVQVYPNPSPGAVTIVNSTENISRLLIYDMSGNLVQEQEIQGVAQVNLTVSGFYYYRITNGKSNEKIVGGSFVISR